MGLKLAHLGDIIPPAIKTLSFWLYHLKTLISWNMSTHETEQTTLRPWGVFLIFLKLGLTSFGGPVAHLGFFRQAFVEKRRWLSDQAYADLVALCQFLPGPASSQVGLALGYSQAGYGGAFAAWLGFTMPSALLLIVFALGINVFDSELMAGLIKGLTLVALAVVAQAFWGMAKSLCTDNIRVSIMLVSAVLMLLLSNPIFQILVLVIAGIIGGLFVKLDERSSSHEPAKQVANSGYKRKAAGLCLLVFFALLFGLPLLSEWYPVHWLSLVDSFYRAGSLVFGGGHVVLPLLSAEVVPSGRVGEEVFLAGYGAAQAVPGPLFTFAAFLGASNTLGPDAWSGGLIALTAIFVPSFLLVFAALPNWERLRSYGAMKRSLAAVNAAVVGLLLAALYDPVWTKSIGSAPDLAFSLVAMVALVFWKLPPWFVVLLGASVGCFVF